MLIRVYQIDLSTNSVKLQYRCKKKKISMKIIFSLLNRLQWNVTCEMLYMFNTNHNDPAAQRYPLIFSFNSEVRYFISFLLPCLTKCEGF